MKRVIRSFVPILFLFSLVGFISCDKEDYNSYVPTFKGFRITPSDPTIGDSITITAVQAKKGHLIYRATYTWEVKCQGTVMYNGTKKVVYDNEPADPVIGFRLPDDAPVGNYSVKFSANYQFSGQGSVINNGGTYDDPEEGISGQINLVNSGLTGGNCSGSDSFVVSSKQ